MWIWDHPDPEGRVLARLEHHGRSMARWGGNDVSPN